MTAPNHIVGGIATVGIFASISGINILAKPAYLVVIAIASLLPDIDHTRSLIGKLLYPIAKPINRRYGHRTITHSLIFTFFLILLLRLVLIALNVPGPYTTLFGAAYLSHLVFDMMTVQGVPLFYPFLRNPCVLPGKASLRLNTNNLRSETSVFCFFLLSLFFLQPLFSQGFWTSYNRLFGTMKHLRSEFASSPDLLRCTVQYRIGTDLTTATGYVIDVLPQEVVLYDSVAFRTLGAGHQSITHLAPSHSGLALSYHTQSFYNIPADSLTQLLYRHPVTSLEVSSNHPFVCTINDRTTTSKSITASYVNSFSLTPAVDTTTQPFYPDPRINTQYRQLDLLKALQAKEHLAYQAAETQLQQLRQQAHSETNLIRKEGLIHQINTFKLPTIKDYSTDIDREHIQLAQLQRADQIRHKQQLASGKIDLATYSGFYTYLTITPLPHE
ncbi:MAG: metal-dependent hydrolase [Saprospiraceae bacterium]|nr:metal-dependent hydrolase [Saprospiraceae bacterium]